MAEEQTDQWKKTGSPETNPHVCGRAILNKVAKHLSEKEEPFQRMVLEPLDIQPQVTE